MWVSTRVEDKLLALEEDGFDTDTPEVYKRALEEVIAEDEGRTWAIGQ